MRPCSSKAIATGSMTWGSQATSSTLKPLGTRKVVISSRGDKRPAGLTPGGWAADTAAKTVRTRVQRHGMCESPRKLATDEHGRNTDKDRRDPRNHTKGHEKKQLNSF